MSQSATHFRGEAARARGRRSHANLLAFLIGVPLGATILSVIYFGPLRESIARRYVTHPVECVGVLMFSIAAAGLLTKLIACRTERRACRMAIVPPWDGKTISVENARVLLSEVMRLPRRIQNTFLVQRTIAALEFLSSRGSADEFDDHLRDLADSDALDLESSYGLTRFITWAIPIIGFLGTVLGITGAISGVTPEVLEKSLSTVTDGLALAFDTTALALGLTMLTMFLSFIVERVEQGILDRVDRYAEHELAHRFERGTQQGGEVAGIIRQNTEVLLEAVEHLVQKQAALWAQALEKIERRSLEADHTRQERLATSLENALQRTLAIHVQHVSDLEQKFSAHARQILESLGQTAQAARENASDQHAAAARIAEILSGQLQALAQLEEGDKHLLHLQETLNQNLVTLAGTGAFDEALHSLTAAVHLLTARAAPTGSSSARPAIRPGAAA